MKTTFGIITDGTQNIYLENVIDSIRWNLGGTGFTYDIMVVGGQNLGPHIIHIPFDETIKDRWITKKKNLIIQNSDSDIIVFMHDYIALTPMWYKGFRDFGFDWDICMHRIINVDGTRYRDWCVWDDPIFGGKRTIVEPWCSNGLDFFGTPFIPSYNYNKTQHMYISGAYWVAKRHVMIDNQFNESLSWNQGEDVEWSLRIRDKYKYVMNTNCSVKILKPGKSAVFQEVNIV